MFPQGDAARKFLDLFAPIVPRERLHHHFRVLTTMEGYSPALGILREMANHFLDTDGNFVQQFQTDGFDARLWEIYLFGFLTEAGFVMDRSHSRPDFLAWQNGDAICLEAVTVGPSNEGPLADIKSPESGEDMVQFQRNYMPIKFGSPLISKLRKCYWKLPHVRERPLILAIQDFHLFASMIWTSSALPGYLYGQHSTWWFDESNILHIDHEAVTHHRFGEKEIPSGFFAQPNAEHISGVLFSNSATLSKFNRMGYLAGFGSRRVKMVRQGTCVNPDPNADRPKEFTECVHDPHYTETWSEGLSLFHNPQALHPVEPEMFPNIAHHFFDSDRMRSFTPSFHPFGSKTYILVEPDASGA